MRLLVAGVPTGAAPRGGRSVPLWSGEPSTPATNSLAHWLAFRVVEHARRHKITL